MSSNAVLKQAASRAMSPGVSAPRSVAEALPICPACGAPENRATQLRVFSARGESTWGKCNDCAAYYLIGDYDCAAEAAHTVHMPWGQLQAGVELNDFKKRMYDAALAGIKMHAPAAKTILDVGCSFGGFLLEARKRGYDGMGVDIVPEAVAYVKQHGFDAVECESMSQCRLVSEANPVDVLTVLDAHIYWPNQPAELAAAWKLIKPGGLLVMRVITKSHFVAIGRALQPVAPGFSRRFIRRSVIDHRFCMPLRSLLKTISACGFQVESVVPRDAQHSDRSSAAVRMLFAIGDLSWKMLGCHLAPGAMIYARKPLE
ncbi:MAG: methyltransferase domain-containing protein [Planctomycetaceae bacterium]